MAIGRIGEIPGYSLNVSVSIGLSPEVTACEGVGQPWREAWRENTEIQARSMSSPTWASWTWGGLKKQDSWEQEAKKLLKQSGDSDIYATVLFQTDFSVAFLVLPQGEIEDTASADCIQRYKIQSSGNTAILHLKVPLSLYQYVGGWIWILKKIKHKNKSTHKMRAWEKEPQRQSSKILAVINLTLRSWNG